MLPTSVATSTFSGFQPQLLDFLSQLRANNSRDWFQAHRSDYESYFLEPARQFVTALGELLKQLAPDVHAEPRVFGSIFAINRDTRFSADKTPYKAHLDLWFWQGGRPGSNRERPGYFLRLSPESLIVGAGMHSFSADGVLERYREAVLDDARGQRLQDAAERVGQQHIRGRTYKRPLSSLAPKDHPRSDWLRHSGLSAETEFQPAPEPLFTPQAADWCFDQLRAFEPIQGWLVDLLCE